MDLLSGGRRQSPRMLCYTRCIATALFIFGDRAPSKEAPQCHHPPFEQKESVQDSLPADLVLNEHFPSSQDMILEHLDRVFEYLHLSEANHLIVIGTA